MDNGDEFDDFPCRDPEEECRLLLSDEEIKGLRQANISVHIKYDECDYKSVLVPEWILGANDLWCTSTRFAEMEWVEFVLRLQPKEN